MLNKEHWEQIIADYKIAWNCFVGPKHCSGWYRQENKGLFYLLKAYLAAVEEPEKDHLWYARILQQMAYPGHFNLSEYERFHKYIEPSIKEYELVEKPEKYEKEIKFSRIEYENMKARIDYRNGESEECFKRYLSLVDNSELLEENDVWFHDGKVISFIHQGDTATLEFEYDNLKVTLEFGGISKIEMYYDEDNPYIFDFECYPCYQGDTNTKIFDIESHKITCETVRVASIELKKNRKSDNMVDNSTVPVEKNIELYLRQKKMLEQFLERNAISQAQFDKSLGDLTEKMGMQKYRNIK